MKRREFLKAAAVGGATLSMPVFLRNAWAQGAPIKIGMPAALSGAYAQYGIQARRAAELFSKDIKAKRLGRQTNLVFISTCHAADSVTTMPDAFAIAKTKSVGSANQGPEFFVGYVGLRWDSDEWIFEQRFWDALGNGKSVGQAFDFAMLGAFKDPDFDADWWGTYQWTGVAGPWTTCTNCI